MEAEDDGSQGLRPDGSSPKGLTCVNGRTARKPRCAADSARWPGSLRRHGFAAVGGYCRPREQSGSRTVRCQLKRPELGRLIYKWRLVMFFVVVLKALVFVPEVRKPKRCKRLHRS